MKHEPQPCQVSKEMYVIPLHRQFISLSRLTHLTHCCNWIAHIEHAHHEKGSITGLSDISDSPNNGVCNASRGRERSRYKPLLDI